MHLIPCQDVCGINCSHKKHSLQYSEVNWMVKVWFIVEFNNSCPIARQLIKVKYTSNALCVFLIDLDSVPPKPRKEHAAFYTFCITQHTYVFSQLTAFSSAC